MTEQEAMNLLPGDRVEVMGMNPVVSDLLEVWFDFDIDDFRCANGELFAVADPPINLFWGENFVRVVHADGRQGQIRPPFLKSILPSLAIGV
jgi:hypothetical protein